MNSIKNLAKSLNPIDPSELKKVKTFSEIPEFIPREISLDPDMPRGTCNYSSLKFIDNKTLIDSCENIYYYNACLCEYGEEYRLFYRVGKNPKGYQDRIATCLLTRDMKVIQRSNRYIGVHSNWNESKSGTENGATYVPFMFSDGEHVEDPRAVWFNGHWFVIYTDGIRIGVAKLDEACNTIYSHYLTIDFEIINNDFDGREKNWIPFVVDNKLYIIYSDDPRTILTCMDLGTSLYISFFYKYTFPIKWSYGGIRGGTPPCEYSNNHLIFFFHSAKSYPSHNPWFGSKVYCIGAYVTETKHPFYVTKVTKVPLLVGIPGPQNRMIDYSHNVVFPCGAVKTEYGWRLSMGVHDKDIALLDVKESDFYWEPFIRPYERRTLS
jgi:predicted GH43/DUF377 family glycosyl hydrolase